MNNTSSSSGNTAGNTNEKKIFVTDPFPVVRYLNMALAAGMLIFAVINILSIFSLSWSTAIIISFMFSIYQM